MSIEVARGVTPGFVLPGRTEPLAEGETIHYGDGPEKGNFHVAHGVIGGAVGTAIGIGLGVGISKLLKRSPNALIIGLSSAALGATAGYINGTRNATLKHATHVSADAIPELPTPQAEQRSGWIPTKNFDAILGSLTIPLEQSMTEKAMDFEPNAHRFGEQVNGKTRWMDNNNPVAVAGYKSLSGAMQAALDRPGSQAVYQQAGGQFFVWDINLEEAISSSASDKVHGFQAYSREIDDTREDKQGSSAKAIEMDGQFLAPGRVDDKFGRNAYMWVVPHINEAQ